MSPSLAASKQWFENSSRLTDAAVLRAVRESLPWSLAGLAAGLLVFCFMLPIAQAVIPAFAVMGIALAGILAYRLAVHLHLSAAVLVPAALLAFALALPRLSAGESALAYLQRAGRSALFLAIVTALAVACACWLVRRAGCWRVRADLLGAAIALAILLALYASHISVGDALTSALEPLARLGDTWIALLVIVFVETLLWTFGIHGPATLAAIVTPVYLTLQFDNTKAHFAHQPLPHIVVVSLFLFIFPGGAGSTLPLAAMLALSKVPRLRTLGRLTILPALVNINDPLIVGLPLVFNPFFAVPFTVVPLMLAGITWLAVDRGWVARPALYMPSMIPSPISVFLATFDWRAVVLVLVNIAIAAVVYWPFFKWYEGHVRSD
jgi:cellobiose-specific phosphotransferase system component IIC